MLIGWRNDVVRWLPQTASLYAAVGLPINLRGLVFTNVTTERETHEGVEVLVVEGSIVNDFKRAAPRCLACAFPCATGAATRSTAGPHCRTATPRCASSTGAISTPSFLQMPK